MSSTGTYAKLIPSGKTKEKIGEIVNLLNIPNPACLHDLHVTVVYSRKEVPEINSVAFPGPIVAKGSEFALFDNQDGSKCLVLKLDSDELHELHNQCRDLGASHDFPQYNPHITLSYDYPIDVPNETIVDYFKELLFVDFIVEPLELNWKSI